jgi:hypothetical protein
MQNHQPQKIVQSELKPTVSENAGREQSEDAESQTESAREGRFIELERQLMSGGTQGGARTVRSGMKDPRTGVNRRSASNEGEDYEGSKTGYASHQDTQQFGHLLIGENLKRLHAQSRPTEIPSRGNARADSSRPRMRRS